MAEQTLFDSILPVKKPNLKYDHTGEKFGLLKVVRYLGVRYGGKHNAWECRCKCGAVVEVLGQNLRRGRHSSCGHCLHKTHGATMRGSDQNLRRTYRIWSNMRTRCSNPNADRYGCYGGRGIRVCDQWDSSFEDFLADMGICPPGMTIERDNVNGNYEPGNCRWATRHEQYQNKQDSVKITFSGETLTISEWSRRLGGRKGMVQKRLDLGWSIDKALTVPALPQYQRPHH